MNARQIAGVLALTLAACGGSDKKAPPNAAANTSFTYAAATTATSTQSGALTDTVGAAADFSAAPSAANGMATMDFFTVSGALLGSGTFVQAQQQAVAQAGAQSPRLRTLAARTMAAVAQPPAMPGSGFDNANCVAVSATAVVFTACSVTQDYTDTTDGTVYHSVVTLNGSITWTAGTRTVAWDIRLTGSETATGTTPAASSSTNMSFHLSGSQTFSATTLVGSQACEIDMTISANGQSFSIGVDMSLAYDLTYTDAVTCPTRVTAGTLEAKQVWTTRPTGVTAAQLPDRAAKVTWTGCGAATIQYGTR